MGAMLVVRLGSLRVFSPSQPNSRIVLGNVEKAGFEILQVTNIYLDVVKTIIARSPA
jgi:hypothetical protein